MIRSGQLAAALLALAAVTACERTHPSDDNAREAASAMRTGTAAAAPADAARPNRVLDPARFADPKTRAAYASAKQYAHVLEGIYCYCHCRENLGHRALVECYETEHAADCEICQMEAMVAARMTAEGRSVREIQQAIDEYYRS